MVYSKIDPAPNKLELDAIQRVFPNATIIISPQEVLNELCSVSFGLQSHVNRPDVLAALQKIMENQPIIPPVGISVANNRATKSKFSTIFFLGPTALFTFVNSVPCLSVGNSKINIEPRWNELKLIPNLVQLYGWVNKSKIEIAETIEALGIEPGRYLMKTSRGQYVDFVIIIVTKEKIPSFIHDVEVNLPGVTVNLVTLDSNLLEKKVMEQSQQGPDSNHQFSKLVVAQIETSKELLLLEGKTRKLFDVVRALQQELKILKETKAQLEQQKEQQENEDPQKLGTKRTRSGSMSSEKSSKKKGG